MKKIFSLIIVSVFALQPASYAAWTSGVVKAIEDRVVTIERNNADIQEAYPKELKVKVLDNAKLKNISALTDLQTGNEVKMDVRANKEQGIWDANYVELIDSDKDQNATK